MRKNTDEALEQYYYQNFARDISIYNGKINTLDEYYNRLGLLNEQITTWLEEWYWQREDSIGLQYKVEGEWYGEIREAYDTYSYEQLFMDTFVEYRTLIENMKNEVNAKMLAIEGEIEMYNQSINSLMSQYLEYVWEEKFGKK